MINHSMSKEATRCHLCRRSRIKAVEDQLERGTLCDFPGCIFKEDIRKALKKKRLNINNIKKPKTKVPIRKKNK